MEKLFIVAILLITLFTISCQSVKPYLEEQDYCSRDNECHFGKSCCSMVPLNKIHSKTSSANCEMVCPPDAFDIPQGKLVCLDNRCVFSGEETE
tara:strand:+ start:263 stop:544 length:282 start_codon:yes stop_codon:yes gene_type:complete